MKQIKLFFLSLLLMFAVFSCDNDKIDFSEEIQQENAGLQGLDPNRTPGVLLCDLDCPYGGFQIKVYEHAPGVIRYNFHPRNTIYVNHAYHSANFPNSPTSNPYTFDYFLINNTNSNAPWKDINGDVIMGSVYVYKLKNPQCLSYFNTNLLYGVSSPCDLNTALLHLNQASRKPSSNCGNPNIICPAPPIVSIPHVPQKPFKIPPAFNIYFGYDCTPTSNGVCFVSRQVGPDDIAHPAVGPISFQYLEESNTMQVNLWRDPQVTELEIYGSNTLLDENIITYYQLDPEATVQAGTYEIIESDYGYGYVMLELDN